MFISDPDFYPSRIPDPTTATKEEEKEICCPVPIFVATISRNFKLFFLTGTEKNLSQQTKNFCTFYE
jgi:hypothetical protein